jgi:hypothetical protein
VVHKAGVCAKDASCGGTGQMTKECRLISKYSDVERNVTIGVIVVVCGTRWLNML